MLTSGVRQFRHWKEAGILADYHVLFSRYVDTDGWDMMSLLTFSSYAGLEKWELMQVAEKLANYDSTEAQWRISFAYATRRAASCDEL